MKVKRLHKELPSFNGGNYCVYNSFNHFNNPYFDWFQSWNRKNQSTYSLAKTMVSLGSVLKKAADVQVQYDMLVK